jgi:hypothetical protein
MSDLRKAAEIALKQLERDDVYLGHRSKPRADAIQALRQALAQPKSEWVGLTDEEVFLISEYPECCQVSIRNAEAKLKEKNT